MLQKVFVAGLHPVLQEQNLFHQEQAVSGHHEQAVSGHHKSLKMYTGIAQVLDP